MNNKVLASAVGKVSSRLTKLNCRLKRTKLFSGEKSVTNKVHIKSYKDDRISRQEEQNSYFNGITCLRT